MNKRLIGVGASVLAATAIAGAAVGPAATASATLPSVAVTVSGKTITLPSTVPAGAVTVTSTVSKSKGTVVGLAKLAPGVSVQQAFAAVNKAHGNANALQGLASITFSDPVGPGANSAQTVLTPGNWVALNFFGNGAPSFQTFTVTSSTSSTALPTPAATVREIDFAFKGPSTMHDGELVRFENDGYLVHMIIGVKFKNRAAAKLAAVDLVAGKDKAAQKLVTGQTAFMLDNSPGAMQQETVNAAPGAYVLACFEATQSGIEHTRLGMVKVVTVTK